MSDYCSLADVYGLTSAIGTLRDPVTGPPAVPGTTPTETQGVAICGHVTAQIDLHLQAKGYTLPIEDTKVLRMLTGIAASGVAARILKARFPASEGAGSDKGAGSLHESDYQAGLKLIDEGGLGPVAKTTGSFNHGFLTTAERAELDPPY